MVTTCLQRPPFWGPNMKIIIFKWPLNNNHLSTTATILGSHVWSLFTGCIEKFQIILIFFLIYKKRSSLSNLISNNDFVDVLDDARQVADEEDDNDGGQRGRVVWLRTSENQSKQRNKTFVKNEKIHIQRE